MPAEQKGTSLRDPTPEEVEAMYQFARSRGFWVHILHGDALRSMLGMMKGGSDGKR